jgi:hypothetical protein
MKNEARSTAQSFGERIFTLSAEIFLARQGSVYHIGQEAVKKIKLC